MELKNFVGRNAELSELERAMVAASNGQITLQLLSGEPGIGKTTLARAFEAQACNQGFVAAWGRCWEAGSAPAFWPWKGILKSCASIIGEARFSELLTGSFDLDELPDSLRGGLPATFNQHHSDGRVITLNEGARLRVFEAISQVLAESCKNTKLLIIFDDMHAADASSLTLLLYIMRQLAEVPLMILGAYRTKEAESSTEISQPLAKVAREGHTIELGGLNEQHSAELYKQFTGELITPKLAEELEAVSGGNPLFFTEFARLQSQRNQLDGAALPLVLKDILEQRIRLLSPDCLEALATAALIGREFSSRLLVMALNNSGSEPESLLAPALELNIVERLSVGAAPTLASDYRFNHDFIREFFSRKITSKQCQQLHQNIALAMERARSDIAFPLSTVARHYHASLPISPLGTVIKRLRTAATAALRSGAYEEALELSSLSLNALLASGGDNHRDAAEAYLVAGRSSLALGEFKQAKTNFNLSFDEACNAKSGRDAIRAALGCGAMTDIGNTGPKLISQLRRGLELAEADEIALRSLAMARLAQALLYSHEREEAKRQAHEARDLCQKCDDPVVHAQVLHFTAQAIYEPGNIATRISDAQRIITLAQQAGNARIEVLGLEELIQHSLEAGNFVQADHSRSMLKKIAEELQNNLPTWLAMTHEALRLAIAGHFDDAEAQAVKALEHGSGNSNLMAWMLYFAMLHQLHWHRNTVELAIPTLEETRRQLPQSSSAHIGLLYAQSEVTPDDPAIVAELDQYVRNDFSDIAPDTYWLISMGMLSEIAVSADHQLAAARLYERLLPHADQHALIYHGCYRGSVSRTLGQLAQCGGDYASADSHYLYAINAERKMHSIAYECYARINRVEALLDSRRPNQTSHIADECAVIEKYLANFNFPRALKQYETLQLRLKNPNNTKSAVPAIQCRVQLRKEAQYWSLAVEGRLHRVRHSTGLDYLSQLLTSAGRPISAVDLVTSSANTAQKTAPDETQGCTVTNNLGASSELLDPQARAQYKQRIESLRDSIAEAENNNDLGSLTRHQAEMDIVTEQLIAATGIGGRPREFSSHADRARSAATKAIRTTIKKIAQLEPAIGSYLQDNIKTGRFCEYKPGAMQQVGWEILHISDARGK